MSSPLRLNIFSQENLINCYDWSFSGLKNRLALERTNRLLNPCEYRSPIQIRTGLRFNTLDQLKLVLIKHVPSSGS